MAPSEKDRRAAALAAAEARLKGSPSPAELEDAPKTPKVEQWKQPTEKEDIEAKRVFARMIDRGIVRDNGYRQSADAVETLLKIANNILQNSDEKFRKLKSTNKMLKEKVLAARGGHEYLIATIDFTLTYVLAPTLRRMHELRLGADVLESHLPALQARVTGLNSSNVNHKSEEAQRVARALREIDEDRDLVKARIERERIVREAREKAQREEEAQKKRKEQAEEEDEYDELDAAIGRGGNVAEYMASQSAMTETSSGSQGPQRLGGGVVGEDEVMDEDDAEGDEDEDGSEVDEDEDEDENGDGELQSATRRADRSVRGLMVDVPPSAGPSYNNGNSTHVQAPHQPHHHHHPHAASASRGRGHPRNRHAGSSTDDRRSVINPSLRRGGARSGPRAAFGGSGNVLGGQAAAGSNEDEGDTEADGLDEMQGLLPARGGDGNEGGQTTGGRVLGSA